MQTKYLYVLKENILITNLSTKKRGGGGVTGAGEVGENGLEVDLPWCRSASVVCLK